MFLNPTKNEIMKGISYRSPEEIREELIREFNWNIEKMAADYGRSVAEMALLLQNGGKNYRKKVKASYQLTFCPMTCVTVEVKDPHNIDDKELETIVNTAAEKIRKDFFEKIGMENLDSIKLYAIDGTLVPPDQPASESDCGGIDPEILVELSALAYQQLYAIRNEGTWVNETIRSYAKELTEKHRDTNWDQTDFWITMEEEAEKLIESVRKKQ